MAIFKFIYKNENFIQSLYSQIFKGLLQTMELQESATDTSEKSGKFTIPGMAEANIKGSDINISCHKSSILPHDSAIFDVFSILKDRMKFDLENISFGDILRLQGSTLIIPGGIEADAVDLFFDLFSQHIPLNALPKSANPAKVRQSLVAFIKKTMSSQDLDKEYSRFLFLVNDGKILRGSLVDADLQESNKATIFKYGLKPIPSEIIAVYEEVKENNSPIIPSQSFLGYLHSLVGQMNEIYLHGLPPTIPVTPIAIFYELNDTDNLQLDDVDQN